MPIRDLVVLVIDDDNDVRRITKRVLAETGPFKIRIANSATHAREILRTLETIDAVSCDIRLIHQHEGLQLISQIRQRHPHIYIEAVTAYSQYEPVALESGADKVIIKGEPLKVTGRPAERIGRGILKSKFNYLSQFVELNSDHVDRLIEYAINEMEHLGLLVSTIDNVINQLKMVNNIIMHSRDLSDFELVETLVREYTRSIFLTSLFGYSNMFKDYTSKKDLSELMETLRPTPKFRIAEHSQNSIIVRSDTFSEISTALVSQNWAGSLVMFHLEEVGSELALSDLIDSLRAEDFPVAELHLTLLGLKKAGLIESDGNNIRLSELGNKIGKALVEYLSH